MEEHSTGVTTEHLFVGIDGGVSNGFAVWSRRQKKFVGLATLSFWDCIFNLNRFLEQCVRNKWYLTVVIEDVSGNRPVFIRKHIEEDEELDDETKEKIMLKIAQNIGGVKAYTQLIIEWCEQRKIRVIKVVPKRNSATKLTHEEFVERTGYDGKRVSQHARDGALLVFNR